MADAWALFLAMDTQWNLVGAGMAGAFRTGLRYEALPIAAASIGLSWPIPAPVFVDLRALEGEALRYWSAKRQ